MRTFSMLSLVSLVLITGCTAADDGDDSEEGVTLQQSDALALRGKMLKKPRLPARCRTGSKLPLCKLLAGEPSFGGPVDEHLGRGWNDISDLDAPSYYSCLEPITVSDPGLTRPTVESKFHFASTTETLFQSLSLDARVSGTDPTKTVPVAASVGGTMLQTATAHRNAINIVLHSKVTFGPKRISATPRMAAGALERFDRSGPRAFRDLCGDRYVESVTPGGEFFAVVQITSSNAKTQSDLRARLSAAFAAGDDAGAALQKVVNATNLGDGAGINLGGSSRATSDVGAVEVRIETLQRGGSDLSIPTTIAELRSRFASFPTSITSARQTAVMGIRTASYKALPTFGTRTPFSVTDASSSVNRILAPRFVQWLDLYNEATYALANPSRFFTFDSVVVTRLQQKASDALTQIESTLDACGTGAACAEGTMRTTVPDPSAELGRLPLRKQRYVITAERFRAAAEAAGALTKFERKWGNGQCIVDKDTSPPVPPPGHFRVWTSRGLSLPDTRCHFKLFSGGFLRAPWQVDSLDYDIRLSENQVIEHVSNERDLTFEFEQVSPFVSFAPDTSAVFNGITLLGPAGDESDEPWREAIESR